MGKVTTGREPFFRDSRPHYVYQFFDKDGRRLYVGMSASPAGRINAHASSTWWPRVDHIEADVYPDREQAMRAEARLIAEHEPFYNWQHTEKAAGSRSGGRAGGSSWRKSDLVPDA